MYVLGMFFLTIILVPLAILAKTRDQSINDLFDEKLYKESILVSMLLDIAFINDLFIFALPAKIDKDSVSV